MNCRRCGAEYDEKTIDSEWGRTIGVGYGPQPRCVALVNREGQLILEHADHVAGIAAPDPQDPLHVCGGPLS